MPSLKNTRYICFHICRMAKTIGKAKIALMPNIHKYKRAKSAMISFNPAPFTLRMATSFCRRSVSRVMAEYTPSKVMIRHTMEKNRMMPFKLFSKDWYSTMSPC